MSLTSSLTLNDRVRGCLLGLAAGDAVGAAVEFSPRGGFAPVTTMRAGGPFGLAAGEWTDDTSMALCLADSLLQAGEFNPSDQLTRYLRWRDRGENSVTGQIAGALAGESGLPPTWLAHLAWRPHLTLLACRLLAASSERVV